MLRIAEESGYRGTLKDYDALQLVPPGEIFHNQEEMVVFARKAYNTASRS